MEEDNWDDGDPNYFDHPSKKLLVNVTAEELPFFFKSLDLGSDEPLILNAFNMLDGGMFEEEWKKENQGELKNLLGNLPSLRQAGFYKKVRLACTWNSKEQSVVERSRLIASTLSAVTRSSSPQPPGAPAEAPRVPFNNMTQSDLESLLTSLKTDTSAIKKITNAGVEILFRKLEEDGVTGGDLAKYYELSQATGDSLVMQLGPFHPDMSSVQYDKLVKGLKRSADNISSSSNDDSSEAQKLRMSMFEANSDKKGNKFGNKKQPAGKRGKPIQENLSQPQGLFVPPAEKSIKFNNNVYTNRSQTFNSNEDNHKILSSNFDVRNGSLVINFPSGSEDDFKSQLALEVNKYFEAEPGGRKSGDIWLYYTKDRSSTLIPVSQLNFIKLTVIQALMNKKGLTWYILLIDENIDVL